MNACEKMLRCGVATVQCNVFTVRRGDVALHRLYQNIRTLQRSTLNIPSV
ncbi:MULTISPECIES: hypothetical protein [unclassified Roseiflexus]|jgi:hypothetical protein|nr:MULTISPECIES: hypothetical protein [unclassified Roseiflexus]MCL6542645.1 hypothetical protein [Roseiflexus sp.]